MQILLIYFIILIIFCLLVKQNPTIVYIFSPNSKLYVEKKSVYPTSCLKFLGIQIDTNTMEFRLPLDIIVCMQKMDFVLAKDKLD